jgi:hypothetical protein
MVVETFSARKIVDSGKYARGSCDSKPGFQAQYFAKGVLVFIAGGLAFRRQGSVRGNKLYSSVYLRKEHEAALKRCR